MSENIVRVGKPRLTWTGRRMLRAMLRLLKYDSTKRVYDIARRIATEQNIPINSAVLSTALRLHAREQSDG